ncbi:hypothetical protein IWZ01DRAFT_477647 [Phyllosticta capitalensis]
MEKKSATEPTSPPAEKQRRMTATLSSFPSRPQSLLTPFTSFDDTLRSLSSSPSAVALETARASLEQAVPAPITPAAAPSFGASSYLGGPTSAAPPDLRDYYARRRESTVCPFDTTAAVRPSFQRRPSTLQHQHLLTAPGLLEAQSQRLGEGEDDIAENEEEEAQQRAPVVASPQRATTIAKTNDGSARLPSLVLEHPTDFDYNDVINSYADRRPSYATLNFSSFSSSSSASIRSGGSGSTAGSASSSDSSSTVTAATGFSTGLTPGVGRRASAPATPTVTTSSWNSFCPLARLPSYDEDDQNKPLPSEKKTGGEAATPVRPGGKRRANAPTRLPLTPFPHHHQSPYSTAPLSPYAHIQRRASAMAAPCSPASGSRGGGRDYMNPHTPPRTPPAAAAIMIAALERRRSESGSVTSRNNSNRSLNGSGSGSASPSSLRGEPFLIEAPRRLEMQCSNCGRCKPEKSRYCCSWPPVHLVLFKGGNERGWPDEEEDTKRDRDSRRKGNSASSGAGLSK